MQNDLNPQELTTEQQIEQLQLQVSELKNTNSQQAQVIEEIEQLQLQVSELKNTNSQQAQVIEEQAKTLGTLTQTATVIMEVKSKKITAPAETVNIGGKEYMFQVACFRMTGEPEIVLSENAALRPDLLQKIIAIEGQGILKEVV